MVSGQAGRRRARQAVASHCAKDPRRELVVVIEIPKKQQGKQRVIDSRATVQFGSAADCGRHLAGDRLPWRRGSSSVVTRLTDHMEIDPPSQVLVADSRLLFAWFHPKTDAAGRHRELRGTGHPPRSVFVNVSGDGGSKVAASAQVAVRRRSSDSRDPCAVHGAVLGSCDRLSRTHGPHTAPRTDVSQT